MKIVEPVLGTRAQVHVTGAVDAVAASAEGQIIDEVGRLEKLFTVFDETSALNEYVRTGSTAVSELIEVSELAERWRERSSGVFDPGIETLVGLWNDAETTGRLPSTDMLNEAIAARDQSAIRFDNLNAIAKGWIAQAAVNVVMSEADVQAAWLSLGGDIVHVGSGSVRVGIEDPHRPYDNVNPLATIEVSNEAVATSGGARRWWTINGRRYSKLLDPRTGLPVDDVASATIVAPDAATADVLATIAAVTDADHTLELTRSADAECLLIHRDGTQTHSSERFACS